MQMTHSRWLLSTSLAGLLATSNALAEERVFDKKFSAASAGTLTVETDTGAVSISGSDSHEVVVHAVLRGSRSAVADFAITADSTQDGVTVHGRRSSTNWLDLSWLFDHSLELHYTIQVPHEYHVQLHTSGGNVELHDLNGNVKIRTSGGNVFITAINGEVQIHTSGGNIRGEQLSGDIRVGTSGGDIKLDSIRGSVEAHTSGGNARLVGIDGKLRAETSGGDVHAELAGTNRGVDLHTSGGDVTVTVPKQFAADLDARASGGDVDCDLPLTSTDSAPGKHRHGSHGTLNGGGNPLVLRTSGGDIEIHAGT